MNDYGFTPSNNRAPGALEVAIRARAEERKSALLMAEYRADASEKRGDQNRSRGLIARLLSSLGLF